MICYAAQTRPLIAQRMAAAATAGNDAGPRPFPAGRKAPDVASFPSHPWLSGGGKHVCRRSRRRRVERTDDWEQLELLCAWEEQREYERVGAPAGRVRFETAVSGSFFRGWVHLGILVTGVRNPTGARPRRSARGAQGTGAARATPAGRSLVGAGQRRGPGDRRLVPLPHPAGARQGAAARG